ncbi:MAG: hypothetical protein ACREUY_01065, partial [Burkholderiales bacterium]
MNMIQLARQANRPGQEIISDEFYVYTTGRPAAGLAAGGVSQSNIQIQNDSDFLIEKLTFNADIAGATQTDSSRLLPNVSVLLINTSSGRQLMNVQFPLTGIFGNGQL